MLKETFINIQNIYSQMYLLPNHFGFLYKIYPERPAPKNSGNFTTDSMQREQHS